MTGNEGKYERTSASDQKESQECCVVERALLVPKRGGGDWRSGGVFNGSREGRDGADRTRALKGRKKKAREQERGKRPGGEGDPGQQRGRGTREKGWRKTRKPRMNGKKEQSGGGSGGRVEKTKEAIKGGGQKNARRGDQEKRNREGTDGNAKGERKITMTPRKSRPLQAERNLLKRKDVELKSHGWTWPKGVDIQEDKIQLPTGRVVKEKNRDALGRH